MLLEAAVPFPILFHTLALNPPLQLISFRVARRTVADFDAIFSKSMKLMSQKQPTQRARKQISQSNRLFSRNSSYVTKLYVKKNAFVEPYTSEVSHPASSLKSLSPYSIDRKSLKNRQNRPDKPDVTGSTRVSLAAGLIHQIKAPIFGFDERNFPVSEISATGRCAKMRVWHL